MSKMLRSSLVLALVLPLFGCSPVDLIRSEAYKAGADAGRDYSDANDFLNKAKSWIDQLGGKNEVTDSTPEQRCEFLWNATGLLTYRLENTEKNQKDFVKGCQTTING